MGISGPPLVGGEPKYTSWRWAVLLAFMLNSGANSFMFLDFSEVPGTTNVVFGYCTIEEYDEDSDKYCGGGAAFSGWTYSASLLAVLPLVFPVMMNIQRYNWATTFFGVSCNLLGAWLRYASVLLGKNGDYNEGRTLAILSSIFIGFSAAVVIVSYSSVSNRWFPPHQRTLATTLAVQSNYTGWMIGTFLFPQTTTEGDVDDMVMVMFYQGLFLCLCFLAFLLCWRERAPNAGDSVDDHPPLLASLRQLATNHGFLLQCLCFSVLGGVSFSVPGFLPQALKKFSLTEKEAGWQNFTFVFSGVFTGLMAGKYMDKPRDWPFFLKSVFVVASLSLGGLVAMVRMQDDLTRTDIDVLLPSLLVFAGGSTLGFIGIGLSATVRQALPIHGEYSAGMVEWWIQIVGAILLQVTLLSSSFTFHAFTVCAIPTWLVTGALLLFYPKEPGKEGYNRM